jgi:hypothetical protein
MKCCNCGIENHDDDGLCPSCEEVLNFWTEWADAFHVSLEEGLGRTGANLPLLTPALVKFYRD